ncbi:hypothetical protein ACYX7E_14715 [Luteimonas sp. RIT-PG2_3]
MKTTLVSVATIALALLTSPATAIAAPSAKQLQALRAAVTENFKDPASAQFRRLELVSGPDSPQKNPGEGIYCGEVNAKNSLGAYVGFMPFMAAILGDGAFAIKVAEDTDGVTIVREVCRRAKAGELGADQP